MNTLYGKQRAHNDGGATSDIAMAYSAPLIFSNIRNDVSVEYTADSATAINNSTVIVLLLFIIMIVLLLIITELLLIVQSASSI
jgi:hypothetical protein